MSTTPEAGRTQEHPSTRAHCSEEPFLGAEGLALAGLILRAFAARTGAAARAPAPATTAARHRRGARAARTAATSAAGAESASTAVP